MADQIKKWLKSHILPREFILNKVELHSHLTPENLNTKFVLKEKKERKTISCF